MALRALTLTANRSTFKSLCIVNRCTMSVYRGGVPNKEEAASGKEKVQLEAFKAGVEDPWDREAHYLTDYPEGTGLTKTKPIEVPSSLDRRIVGCNCTVSENFVNYMWLYKGEAKRCTCGIWFELKYRKPPHEIWTPEEMKAPIDGKIASME